jgi:UDP-glucose 4-epimerase
MKKESILITGAAGFIGSHVARELLQLYRGRYRLIAADDLSGGFVENLPAGVEFVCADVSQPAIVKALFRTYTPRFVFHLAAYAAEGLSFFIQNFNCRNNLLASINLINESVNSNVERFVFTSSIAVYGHAHPPVDEVCQPRPADPYGIAKFAVEQSLAVASEMFGLRYTIFRPHNVYGEYQNLGDPYRNVVGIFMNQMLKNQPLTIFGDGTQRRAFSYVAGVAWAIAHCLETDAAINQIFNVGADQDYSISELAEEVQHAFGRRAEVHHLAPRNEVQAIYAKHDKAKAVFPDMPHIELRGGIQRMARWAVQRGPMEPQKFSGIEISKNMPPSWAKFTL